MMTRVLPVPAPAMTSSGPSPWVMARRLRVVQLERVVWRRLQVEQRANEGGKISGETLKQGYRECEANGNSRRTAVESLGCGH